MSIELYFSNQLDQLADRFSDVVTAEVRGKGNILEAPVVIVPNANLAKWLQLVLAEKNSIIMNVAFQYLEAGLWEMLAALDPGENKPAMMDNDQLKILLLHILQNLDRSDADFLPITQYLFGEDDAGRPDDAARLWQLAEKIAHLFKEYEFHRTDMIQKWAATTTETEGMERCQQRLYARLKFLRDELASRTDKQGPADHLRHRRNHSPVLPISWLGLMVYGLGIQPKGGHWASAPSTSPSPIRYRVPDRLADKDRPSRLCSVAPRHRRYWR